MAELQIRRADVVLWLTYYVQFRERYGIGSEYIKNLRDVVMLAARDEAIAAEQREELGVLVRQIDDERSAGVNAGDRLEQFQ